MKRSIQSYFNSGCFTKDKIPAGASSFMVDCPFCDKPFSSQMIELHVSMHINEVDANKIKKQKTACFDIDKTESIEMGQEDLKAFDSSTVLNQSNVLSRMMSKRHLNHSMIFLLELKDGRLFPQILFHSETVQGHFSNKPYKYCWQNNVNVRNFNPALSTRTLPLESFSLTISTNIAASDSTLNSAHFEMPGSTSKSHRALFKSMMQKAYRRGYMQKGGALTFQMLANNPSDTLRRLPIVILEDGLLHPCFSVVVWLMIAVSKGYQAPKWLLLTCLQMYVESVSCKYIDFVCELPANDTVLTPAPACEEIMGRSLDSNGCEEIPEDCVLHSDSFWDIRGPSARRTLVGCILIRAAYGGMKGDVNLLQTSAVQWATRFELLSDTRASATIVRDADSRCEGTTFGRLGVVQYLHPNYLDDIFIVQPLLLTAYESPSPVLSSQPSHSEEQRDKKVGQSIAFTAASTSLLYEEQRAAALRKEKSMLLGLETYISQQISLQADCHAPSPSDTLPRDIPADSVEGVGNSGGVVVSLDAVAELWALDLSSLVPEGIDFHCDSR